MFVNVIESSSLDSFNHLLFPEQSPANQHYIMQQLGRVSETISDVGKKFVEASRAIYEKVNDANAIRMAKAALRMAKGIFHPNEVIPLETLEDLQAAQPVMQRYIMAEPTLREVYHRQMCDGYSDTYTDLEPGVLGVDHYDYRRVMDGIIQDTEGDEEGDWSVTNYLDELIAEDRELTFDEKTHILSTWDIVRMFVQSGDDPTDIFNRKDSI